jgi:hypothetical protein
MPLYGGVAWAEEALACFVDQAYEGPRELLIVNSFPEQTLTGDFPNVRIINLPQRPPSLGELRNICVREAKGEVIAIWDSDDIALPNHLHNIGSNIAGLDWIWLTPQFWVLGQDIQSIVPGACPMFAFRKSLWEKVGGYPPLTVGEDADFIARANVRGEGKKIVLPDSQISLLYRWGQGAYHVSGEGMDRSGLETAHKRTEIALRDRIKRGNEKVGTITLEPRRLVDWQWQATNFLKSKPQKKTAPDPVCIVQLGRYGDVCNVLPIARHVAERYDKPHWIISKEFAPLLEGCSYVVPRPVDLRHDQAKEALALASKEYKYVISGVIWGKGYEIVKACPSYNREAWRMAGFEHKFDDLTWRPVFDKRDLDREDALWRKLGDGRPAIVVNVTKGLSSPFNDGGRLLREIREAYGNVCNIIDVSDLHLPQIYDLVGVIERAILVVTIDTGLLHIASATNTPVVAIVNEKPWLGSEPRCALVRKFTYTEAVQNPAAVIAAMRSPMAAAFRSIRQAVVHAPFRRIFHVCERHDEKNVKEQVRKRAAQASWDVLYAYHDVIPAHLWEKNFPRTAMNIGDPRPLPYLKDVLLNGMDMACDDDIIMWTNDDNYIHQDLPDLLRFHVALYDVVTSQRIELNGKPYPHPSTPPRGWRQFDAGALGRDLFAATKSWLLARWQEIPDFILGASDFDLCLAAMVRKQYGIETTRRNIEPTMWPAEIERGYIAHQWHPPKWREPSIENHAPSQLHNRRLWREWANVHLPSLRFSIHNTI